MNLHCKLVPVQNQEYENGQIVDWFWFYFLLD